MLSAMLLIGTLMQITFDLSLKFYTIIFRINLIVAPCIFVESLQFINQRMHI